MLTPKKVWTSVLSQRLSARRNFITVPSTHYSWPRLGNRYQVLRPFSRARSRCFDLLLDRGWTCPVLRNKMCPSSLVSTRRCWPQGFVDPANEQPWWWFEGGKWIWEDALFPSWAGALVAWNAEPGMSGDKSRRGTRVSWEDPCWSLESVVKDRGVVYHPAKAETSAAAEPPTQHPPNFYTLQQDASDRSSERGQPGHGSLLHAPQHLDTCEMLRNPMLPHSSTDAANMRACIWCSQMRHPKPMGFAEKA